MVCSGTPAPVRLYLARMKRVTNSTPVTWPSMPSPLLRMKIYGYKLAQEASQYRSGRDIVWGIATEANKAYILFDNGFRRHRRS